MTKTFPLVVLLILAIHKPVQAQAFYAGPELAVVAGGVFGLYVGIIGGSVTSVVGISYQLGLSEERYHGVSNGWLFAGMISSTLTLGAFGVLLSLRPDAWVVGAVGTPLLSTGLAAATMTVIGVIHRESSVLVVPTALASRSGNMVPGLAFSAKW